MGRAELHGGADAGFEDADYGLSLLGRGRRGGGEFGPEARHKRVWAVACYEEGVVVWE